MGIWVFPIALLLLCLTSESLQGGEGGLLGRTISLVPLRTHLLSFSPAFGGDVKPQKPGLSVQNGYGTENPGGRLGFGGVVMPQKSGYGPGLGARVFAGVAAQPGKDPWDQKERGWFWMKAYSPYIAWPPLTLFCCLPGFGNGNGIGAGAFPGVGAHPGLGAGMKTQKPGEHHLTYTSLPGFGGVGKPQKPGIRDGNGLGAGAFPETGVQPGETGLLEGWKNGGQIGLDSVFPPSQTWEGSPSYPHPLFSSGYGNGNGLDVLPGSGKEHRRGTRHLRHRWSWEGPGASQVRPFLSLFLPPLIFIYPMLPAFLPGYMPENRLGIPPGYNGNGMATQSGPCSGGIAPPQLLPRSPTPGVPSDKGGSWGLKSQLLPPVQNAPTPAIQWGLKPQKAGYQPSNGYGAEAELGEKSFHYGNGALEAGIFPETLKSVFPITNGFRNGRREETLLYPKATVPTLERNGKIIIMMMMMIIIHSPPAGQAEALLALQHWGAGMKPGYGYAGLGNQAGKWGVLLSDDFGDITSALTLFCLSPGHCPSGKC
uniref:Uncharacterized protein n=1 Tax=Cricetulus griseus TaxID=10029 RepID=A0A8C2M4L8_CRIGR